MARLHRSRPLAIAALLVALFPALSGLLARSRAGGPGDLEPESPPAPLLVPGRPDSLEVDRSKRAREYYALGRDLEHQAHPASAVAAYQSALRLDPTVPDAAFRLGRLMLAVQQFAEAASQFRSEWERDPRRTDAQRELGLALARGGEPGQALVVLDSLVRVAPRDDQAWQALAFAELAAGHAEEAERALRRAIALSPDRADEHRDLGAVLAARGRLDAARVAYRRAVALDRADGSAWINLGNLERREHKLEPALAAYRAAERADSTLAPALQGQVAVLRALGRDAEAGTVYRRWLAIRPDDHVARYEAVALFDALGRTDLALEVARDGVRRQPRSADARLVLGMALGGAGEYRAALGEMRRAEELLRGDEDRARARGAIAVLRARAPDSLRALFEQDSIAHATR